MNDEMKKSGRMAELLTSLFLNREIVELGRTQSGDLVSIEIVELTFKERTAIYKKKAAGGEEDGFSLIAAMIVACCYEAGGKVRAFESVDEVDGLPSVLTTKLWQAIQRVNGLVQPELEPDPDIEESVVPPSEAEKKRLKRLRWPASLYDLARAWGVLPQALAELPCTQVDDLLAFADYEASRSRRWEKEAELRSKRDSKRAETRDRKPRGRLGAPHVE